MIHQHTSTDPKEHEMYHRREHRLRRLEHTRLQHQQRASRQDHLDRHAVQMHLARMTR